MTIEEAIRKFEIFRNETKKVLDSNENHYLKNFESFYREKIEMAELSISALRAQQEKQFGGWISVEDELPERFQPVIICWEKKRGEYIVEQGTRDVEDWWKVYDGTRTKKVLFWMPLSWPPQEV